MAQSSLTKRPEVLYQASVEHIKSLDLLREAEQWPLTIYVAGLSVECVLQAMALHGGRDDDIKHNLQKWLARCPETLQTTIRQQVADDWSFLNAIWDNRIRYLSHAGLIGYLREKKLNRGIKGSNESVLKVNVDKAIVAARSVHDKGITTWRRSYLRK